MNSACRDPRVTFLCYEKQHIDSERKPAHSRGLKHTFSEDLKVQHSVSEVLNFRDLLYVFPLAAEPQCWASLSLEGRDGAHKSGVCLTERWPRLSLCFSYFNINAGTSPDDLQSGH